MPMHYGTYYDHEPPTTGSAVVDSFIEGMTNNAMLVHDAVARIVEAMEAERRRLAQVRAA